MENDIWRTAAGMLKDFSGPFVLMGPEDTGRRATGTRPASVWRLPWIIALVRDKPATYGAVAMDPSGLEITRPTRLFTNCLGLEGVISEGPPAFDKTGAYTGPLVIKTRTAA